jgi:hypothetical protein
MLIGWDYSMMYTPIYYVHVSHYDNDVFYSHCMKYCKEISIFTVAPIAVAVSLLYWYGSGKMISVDVIMSLRWSSYSRHIVGW